MKIMRTAVAFVLYQWIFIVYFIKQISYSKYRLESDMKQDTTCCYGKITIQSM